MQSLNLTDASHDLCNKAITRRKSNVRHYLIVDLLTEGLGKPFHIL
ncbi:MULTISPECIES: hypothetical protein [unclassified Paludibacterium]|nr:hypothetical protein [Paludibacterium sp. B53371]